MSVLTREKLRYRKHKEMHLKTGIAAHIIHEHSSCALIPLDRLGVTKWTVGIVSGS